MSTEKTVKERLATLEAQMKDILDNHFPTLEGKVNGIDMRLILISKYVWIIVGGVVILQVLVAPVATAFAVIGLTRLLP